MTLPSNRGIHPSDQVQDLPWNIPARFRQQARRNPEAVAIQDHDGRITYAQLEARARGLATFLDRQGVKPGDVVALCLGRGIHLVVAQLAVLDAGAICLPLDPDAPSRHLASLVESTGARVWISESDAPPPVRIPAINVRSPDSWADAQDPALHPSPPASPVGFILFTSGSTGVPKGVCIRQSSVIHLVCDTDYVQVTASDVVMMGSHVAFDAILFEVWGPLLNGGRIEVFHKEECLQPTILARRIRETGVTVAFLTTSLFNLVAALHPVAFAGLRAVLVGGEVASAECMRRVLGCDAPPQAILNVYGPTEATTFSTFHPVDLASLGQGPLPIGKPIRRARILVMDASRQPLPEGQSGEIWIGGEGVAAGYWQQPGLTAERFIFADQAGEPGTLFYATGDMGRFTTGGILEFHGRQDGQVKVRGNRVELAEVEGILRRHPEVEDVAVIAESQEGIARQLVAFVTLRSKDRPHASRPSMSVLLDWMRGEAAPHLVPSRILELDSLPRTPSGKIDRRQLLDLCPAVAMASTPATTPATSDDLEAGILQLWRGLLGRADLSSESRFFDVGGDSLMAVTMLEEVARWTGHPVPLGQWLSSPTPRNLAIQATQPTEASSLRVFVVEWLLRWDSQELSGIPCHILPFPAWGSTPETTSIEHLALGCLESLSKHQPRDPFILVGYSMAGFVALEMARRLQQQGIPPRDVWIVDSLPPSFAQRTSVALARAAGRILGMPFPSQLQMTRIEHSLIEVARPLFQGRLEEGLRRFKHEASLARTLRARKTAKGGQDSSIKPAHAAGSHHINVWANHAFRPQAYDGPVACFVTEGTRLDQPELGHGWSSYLPHMDVVPIPGDHASCVREDRPFLFEALLLRLKQRKVKAP